MSEKISEIRRENRKALPKFLLTLVIAGVFGGFMGFAVSTSAADRLADGFTGVLQAGLRLFTLWGIPVCGTILMGIAWWAYCSAKRTAAEWNGEDEEPVSRAEERMNLALLCINLEMAGAFFILSASYACLRGDEVNLIFVVVAEFIVNVAVMLMIQRRVVDLSRTINPEKKGSVYDLKFQKKWLESCDEAQRAEIGRAAFFAFRMADGACVLMWMVLVLLNFVFEIGLMPSFCVMLLWGILRGTYCLSCMKMKKMGQKIPKKD